MPVPVPDFLTLFVFLRLPINNINSGTGTHTGTGGRQETTEEERERKKYFLHLVLCGFFFLFLCNYVAGGFILGKQDEDLMPYRHDVKFHVDELFEIFKKHDAHTDLEHAALEHLKALREIALKEEKLKELHDYFEKTIFPYYSFEDRVVEMPVLEALEKKEHHIKKQLLNFVSSEMKESRLLRSKLESAKKLFSF